MASSKRGRLNIKVTDAKVLCAVLSVLRENGGPLPRIKVKELVEEKIGPTLTVLEREEIGTARRYPRWEGSFNQKSTEFVKAGFLEKNNGEWRITPAGVNALALREMNLLEEANEKYKLWERSRLE
ncbi:MAG: winged helix-turn-helix domain-containing protein [Nitrospinae bacterium]|nr:winged helix-turn-helix domain-containing protein [Nitrospinota bacterium]